MPRRPATPAPSGKAAKAPRARRRSREELDALRYAARCAFTLEHQPVMLEDLARRPAFRGVGFAKLAAWAREEDWLGERRATIGAWRRRAEVSLNRALQREGRHQRAMLQSLHDQAVSLRCQQVVQPRSWEQVANVQLKTAQMLRQWHHEDLEVAARVVAPQAHAAKPADIPEATHDDLSDQEAQRAASWVLEQRLGDEPDGADNAATGGQDATVGEEPGPVDAAAEDTSPHAASA